MRAVKLAGIVTLLLLGAAAKGPTPEEIYAKGAYLEASAAGVAQGDGPGLALAARAILADATLRDSPCLECLQQAENLARLGITADPDYFESYVELAAAMGYEAKIIGPLHAKMAKFPEESKEAIDKAYRLKPDDPWVLAAQGGWNIEIVRMGGSILGGIFFGANFDEGVKSYRKATGVDPDNLVVKVSYVLALSSYDFEAKRLEIIAVLQSVAQGTPRDAYAKAMKDHAVKLLDLLMHDKRADYQALARKYLGFP